MVILKYGAHKDWENAAGTIKVLDRFRAILDEAIPTPRNAETETA
jgi:hypothetical protein